MLSDADDAFAATLRDALPSIRIDRAPPAYLEEPRGKWHGRPSWLARPADTGEAAALLRFCDDRIVGVVPWGGGTGLVGGQIAPSGALPLIVSLERMNRIRKVDADAFTLTAEAGATLAEVRRAADDQDRLFPLSYASQDSARIGGALAVNSGGLNVLRYGMTRDLCLGIEAVLPDGSIVNRLNRPRKDNTGYDLRHLLIGSEGTLALITAATLKLAPRPARTATAFLSIRDLPAGLTLLSQLRDIAGEAVSAIEIMSRQGLEFLAETHPDIRQPLADPTAWSLLVELGSGASIDPEALLLGAVEAAMEQGLVIDGTLAQGERERADFWAVREAIPLANRRIGAVASHDVALPLSAIEAFVREAQRAVAAFGPYRINAFGHLGDGNLHYNVFPPLGGDRAGHLHSADAITRAVHDCVAAFGGSFSAEHGIGRLKTGELLRYGDPAHLAAMRAIKAALDPNGIMNPGAILSS